MQRLKKITGIILALFAGLAFLAWLIPALFEKQVKSLVISSLNEHLRAEVNAGEISFSVFPAFPYATLKFKDVVVHEPNEFQTTGTVMTAGGVEFHFSLASLFTSSYSLKKIEITNATLNLQTNADGKTNFDIWKKGEKKSGNKKFALALQEVIFKDVGVLYYHVPKEQDISFVIQSGTLSGDFIEKNYTLAAKGNFDQARVSIGGVEYLKAKNGELGLELGVQSDSGLYTFGDSWLLLEDLKLAISGTVTEEDKSLRMNLSIQSPDAGLKELLSLIPSKYLPPIDQYKYNGKVEFNGTVIGVSTASSTPHLDLSFTCRNVSLKPPGSDHELKNLSCKGKFTNRKNKANPVTWLRIENLSAQLDGKPLTADLEVENFKHPRIAVRAELEADMAAFATFFLPDTLEQVSGTVAINARFNGIAGERATYRSSGDIALSDVTFGIKQNPLLFRNCNGILHLDNNDLIVRSVGGRAGNSDFNFTGSFTNLFGWLFEENQDLLVNATFKSGKLILDDWISSATGTTATDSGYQLRLSPRLRLNLNLEIAQFAFRKFRATGIRGEIAMKDRIFTANDLAFSTVGGSVTMIGSISNQNGDSLEISCNSSVKNLDIKQLFQEMGNFGQDVITDRHLKGRVDATVQFKSSWSNKLDINENSIYSKATVQIENGELIRFEPMLALSKYLKGSDLQTVKFSTLSNTIEIRNRHIFIPIMEIKSSAADITASGEHSFDNMVNYKLQLYLSQILGKKVKAQNTEFGTIEDDGLGRPMIYLTMKGPANNPEFSWDRQGVENKISAEISKEAKGLKKVFKDEFGRKDSVTKRPAVSQKKEELQIEYEDEGE